MENGKVRRRSMTAGMTDYTGVSMDTVLAHVADWRDETEEAIKALTETRNETEKNRDDLNHADDIVEYIDYFVDLLGRYCADFRRLGADLPRGVTRAHVEMLQQIHDSSSHEVQRCRDFREFHIYPKLKNETLRPLVDRIYRESRGMLTDYQDLSNLVPRLRTFVGTTPKMEKDLEQKFGILYSPAQESRDFDQWISEASGLSGYTIGVIFLDIDDFKRLNTDFHETVVDKTILPDFQKLVRSVCLHKAVAYRHGGEEIVVLLPNSDLEETNGLAEKLRSRVEAHRFRIDDNRTVQITISVGVAVFPKHGDTLQKVLESANRAERSAKEAGKNRVEKCQTN